MIKVTIKRAFVARKFKRNRAKMGAHCPFFNCMALAAALFLAVPAAVLAKDAGRTVTIVAFGDSLTAGYRLRRKDAFPVRLEKALKARGHRVKVTNAGVSGDTTAAALARLDWAVPKGTDAVILELGGNDALRGLAPGRAKANMGRILKVLKSRGIEVLIAGILAPPNLDDLYAGPFNRIFGELATTYDALLYPFFLEGVAADPRFNLSDGIHPNRKGVAVIVANITPAVEELIARVKARRAARSGG